MSIRWSKEIRDEEKRLRNDSICFWWVWSFFMFSCIILFIILPVYLSVKSQEGNRSKSIEMENNDRAHRNDFIPARLKNKEK